MASKILPVWCSFAWACDIETQGLKRCGRRGLKAHDGMCVEHRAVIAEQFERARAARRAS